MKTLTEYLWFETVKRREIIHITEKVRNIVERSAVKEGLAFVSAMHNTAAVYVNDPDRGLEEDIWEWLERLAPYKPDYKHSLTDDDNGDAHLKNLIIHNQVLLPITEGELDLGTWQRVYYAEFDGQRKKQVIVKVLGE